MDLTDQYLGARRAEEFARLRRILVLRAMQGEGMSQREIANAVGISQSAVSQQLAAAPDLAAVDPETLVNAAAPVLKELAAVRGYTNLAVFGSVARHEARPDSDIDLLVDAPVGTSGFDFVRFKETLEVVLGREVDLVSRGGLKPRIDDDIRREAVLL
ncbi:nucleotidyltransferase domain-containing protein [Kribbia dieselivorans]|uniref:nucleotidyltransferase domain-containing protein n=1 Tax=Kribbia dieselivorans TaxID=331526 RepID=UPI0008384D51|nr:nucleotidyltransferase domain-containing protein [Kribbia dieselivorans]